MLQVTTSGLVSVRGTPTNLFNAFIGPTRSHCDRWGKTYELTGEWHYSQYLTSVSNGNPYTEDYITRVLECVDKNGVRLWNMTGTSIADKAVAQLQTFGYTSASAEDIWAYAGRYGRTSANITHYEKVVGRSGYLELSPKGMAAHFHVLPGGSYALGVIPVGPAWKRKNDISASVYATTRVIFKSNFVLFELKETAKPSVCGVFSFPSYDQQFQITSDFRNYVGAAVSTSNNSNLFGLYYIENEETSNVVSANERLQGWGGFLFPTIGEIKTNNYSRLRGTATWPFETCEIPRICLRPKTQFGITSPRHYNGFFNTGFGQSDYDRGVNPFILTQTNGEVYAYYYINKACKNALKTITSTSPNSYVPRNYFLKRLVSAVTTSTAMVRQRLKEFESGNTRLYASSTYNVSGITGYVAAQIFTSASFSVVSTWSMPWVESYEYSVVGGMNPFVTQMYKPYPAIHRYNASTNSYLVGFIAPYTFVASSMNAGYRFRFFSVDADNLENVSAIGDVVSVRFPASAFNSVSGWGAGALWDSDPHLFWDKSNGKLIIHTKPIKDSFNALIYQVSTSETSVWVQAYYNTTVSANYPYYDSYRVRSESERTTRIVWAIDVSVTEAGIIIHKPRRWQWVLDGV